MHMDGVAGTPRRASDAALDGRLPWRNRFDLLRRYVFPAVPLLLVLDNFEDNLTGTTDAVVTDPDLAELLAAWATMPGRAAVNGWTSSRRLVCCRC
jgi:hypothetical protein